ncbi:MAG TPA: M3 family metallopeptidase, partial [Candidatus Aminicenantes bacterium]|nr:M3 family metallopeptidase [Candidatus Aminicenantes bacterium]
RDGVELPSQIMEHWAFRPELLKLYARHYKSGEVIPEELIEKIRKSSFFNQGFASTEYLAASILDMAWHTTELPESQIDVRGFEQETLNRYGLIPEILPRYRSTYFQHIFAGGYSAGYYVYIWAELLDSDAFEAFQKKGVFDKATAASFRKNILEKYGTADLLKQYVKFRGHEPGIEPLLKKRGFIREK